MIYSLSGVFYIANFPVLWEKRIPSCCHVSYLNTKKEPEFKKGKLQVVTSLFKQAQTRRHQVKDTLKRDN